MFQLADHTNTLSTDSVSVQVYVCAKMRAKIVSEVNVNIDLLQVDDGFGSKALKVYAFIYSILYSFIEMCREVHRYSGKNLSRGQSGEHAHVLSTIELLEERKRRRSSGC